MEASRPDAIDRAYEAHLRRGAALTSPELASAGLSGCGEPPSGSGDCSETTCERGICQPATARCVNPDGCNDSEAGCLAGFSCVEDDCRADVACEEAMKVGAAYFDEVLREASGDRSF